MAGDSLPTNTPIMRKYKKRRRGRRVRRGTAFKIFAKNIFGKIEKSEARNTDKMLIIEDEKRWSDNIAFNIAYNIAFGTIRNKSVSQV